MKSLKMWAIAGCMAFGTATMSAQDKPKLTPEQKTEMREKIKENQDRLALTDAQKKPYFEIQRKYMGKIREVRDQNISKEEKMKAIQQLRDQGNAEVKTLLTDTQYQEYLKIQQERQARLMEKKKG